MAPVRLRGMTWSHRRAVDPLVETLASFQARHPGIEVEWSSRPLSGFEFTPVDVLAKSYDLIILDHPFMGAIAASRSLIALDDVVGPTNGSSALTTSSSGTSDRDAATAPMKG